MTAYCSSNRQSYVVKVGLTNGDGKRRSRPLRVIYEVTLVAPDSTPLGTFINTAVILIGVDYPGDGWVLALVPSLGGQQQAISFHKHESVNMSKLGSIACGNTSWELFYGNTVHPSLYRLSIEVSRRGETIAECRWVSGCMALLLAIHHRVGKCSPANLLPLPLFQQIFMIFADYYHSGIRIVCQDGIDRLVLTEASLSANQHILAKMFLTNRLPPSPLKELLPQLEIGDPVGDAYPNLKQALFEHNATLRIGHSTNQSTALDVTRNGASLLDTCVSIIDMTMDIDHTLCDVDQDLSYCTTGGDNKQHNTAANAAASASTSTSTTTSKWVRTQRTRSCVVFNARNNNNNNPSGEQQWLSLASPRKPTGTALVIPSGLFQSGPVGSLAAAGASASAAVLKSPRVTEKMKSSSSTSLMEPTRLKFLPPESNEQELSLSGVPLQMSVKELVSWVTSESVRYLLLSNCGLNDELLEALMEALGNHQTTFLDLSSNSFSARGIQSLGRSIKAIGLKHLSLAGNSIPFTMDMCTLIESLLLPHLESIDLSETKIDNTGVRTLCQNDFYRLKAVHLYGNTFDFRGALCLSAALIKNKSLIQMDIGGNHIADGIAQLAKAMEVNCTLETLHLVVRTRQELKLMTRVQKNWRHAELKKKLQLAPQGEKLILSQMKLHVIPPLSTQLFKGVHTIDLSSNFLEEMPYSLSSLPSIQHLILKQNRIFSISSSLMHFSQLVSLDLSSNLITSVNDDIGNLTTLKSLNLSHNKLEDLPCSMAKLLRNGTSVHFANNALSAIPRSKLSTSDLLIRFRVILLGDLSAGLLPHLNTIPVLESEELRVNSVDMDQFHFQIFSFSHKAVKSGIHQVFMTDRTLYIIVFDALKYSYSQIQSYKQLISAATSSTLKFNDRAICVGLNAPSDPETQNQIAHTLHPVLKNDALILENLPAQAATAMNKMLVSYAVSLQKLVPGTWAIFGNNIRRCSNSEQVLLWRDFNLLACQYMVDQKTLIEAANFLHSVGILMFFSQVKDWSCVFLSPTLLGKVLFSCVNALNMAPGRSWISSANLERELWRYGSELPKLVHQQVIYLLQRYSMVFPITFPSTIETGLGYLIPSHLEELEPEPISQCTTRLLSDQHLLFTRLLQFGNVPAYFFPQIEASLLQIQDVRPEHLWLTGAVCVTKNRPNVELVRVSGTSTSAGCVVEVQVWEPINEKPVLLDQVMAALSDTVSSLSQSSRVREHLVLCSACVRSLLPYPSCGTFNSAIVVNNFREGKMLICEKCNSAYAPGELAPDLCSGITQKVQIGCTEIKITKLLGRGGYGIVFKGKWNQWDQTRSKCTERDVAVKMLIDKDSSDAERAFTEFRTEVEVMAQLPPNRYLVPLFGVCYTPLMMVMEFAPQGDLRTLLEDASEQISVPLMYHIALDVAKGLDALHSNRPAAYIHRDLRSPNVFLVSKNIRDPVRAKVGDYGLATRLRPSTCGYLPTWRWLAPEVLDSKSCYGTESDIYSFGMVLLELVNRPFPPFQDLDGDPKFSKETTSTVRKTKTKTFSPAQFHECQLEVQKYTTELQKVENQLTEITSELSKLVAQPPRQEVLLQIKSLEEKSEFLKWSKALVENILQNANKFIQEYALSVEEVQREFIVDNLKARDAIINGFRPRIPDTCPQALQSLMQNCWAQDPCERPTARLLIQLLTAAVQQQDMAENCSSIASIEKHELKLLSRYSPTSKAKSLCLAPQNNLSVVTFEDGTVFTAPAFTAFETSQSQEMALIASGSCTLHGSDSMENAIEVKQSATVVVNGVLCIFQGARSKVPTSTKHLNTLYLLPSLQMSTQLFSARIAKLDSAPNMKLDHLVTSMCKVEHDGITELWCGCDSPSAVVRIDVEAKTVQGEIPLHENAAPVCMIQFGDAVWVGIGFKIHIIELSDLNITTVIKTEGRVSRMAKVEGFIFALLQWSKSLEIWQPLTHTLLVTVNLDNPSLGRRVEWNITAICTGMGKVWLGDDHGHITGWDFSQLLSEASASFGEVMKQRQSIVQLEDNLAEPVSQTNVQQEPTEKEANTPTQPLLQVSALPVAVAFIRLPSPSSSSASLSASSSGKLSSSASLLASSTTGKLSSDIPLIGDLQFLDPDTIQHQQVANTATPPPQNNKSGILWCVTNSGPKIICCFKVIPQSQSTNQDSILEYLTETPSALLGSAIAQQVELIKTGELMIVHRIVAGRPRTFDLTRTHFSCDKKNISIPVSDILNVESLASTNLRIFYIKGKATESLTVKAETDERAIEWLSAFRDVLHTITGKF
ncbi:serine/threonineprotein kinase [Pelomyxa schiedti]|nr:serine/threonineprotein kinase [Pelomyxa schiedti]